MERPCAVARGKDINNSHELGKAQTEAHLIDHLKFIRNQVGAKLILCTYIYHIIYMHMCAYVRVCIDR